MGRLAAEDMVAHTDVDTALSWHLTSNHYPPVPLTMIPVCKKAIANANKGDWNKKVRLPKGVYFKGFKLAPTRDIVEQHHLDSFLDPYETGSAIDG